MKRSVAIRGKTPLFLRWSIDYPCRLRDDIATSSPEHTFRKLRVIRELSFAQVEARIRDRYCLHPAANSELPEEALGFSVDEAVALFGGAQEVDRRCRPCPANSLIAENPDLWAGCFGILAKDLRFSLNRIVRGEFSNFPTENNDSDRVVSQNPDMRDVHKRSSDLELLFGHVIRTFGLQTELDNTRWNGDCLFSAIWRSQERSQHHWDLVEKILRFAQQELRQGAWICKGEKRPLDASFDQDLIQLSSAIGRCRQNGLILHTELIPEGYSDGKTWTLFPHCQFCKCRWFDRLQPCRFCGSNGRYQNEIRLKVLGIRPYLLLAPFIGAEATKRMLESCTGG
jgi:hypothetical protein